jgi:hypothetical protein
MAEWSKALHLRCTLFGGVGSNPTVSKLLPKTAIARNVMLPVQYCGSCDDALSWLDNVHKYSSEIHGRESLDGQECEETRDAQICEETNN